MLMKLQRQGLGLLDAIGTSIRTILALNVLALMFAAFFLAGLKGLQRCLDQGGRVC